MRALIPSAAFLLAIALTQPASAFEYSAAYSASSLATELHRLQRDVRDGRALNLPSAWDVEGSEGKYSISTQPLRDMLASPEKAAGWLDHLAQQLEGSAVADSAPSGTRARLDRILARREFGEVGPPGFFQLLWQRVFAWIGEWLGRLFNFVGQHPVTSRILFWSLVTGAAVVLLMWLIRMGHKDRAPLSLRGPHPPIAARAWSEWIAAARQAADQGDLRQAMHCAYWAGVARLQETGVLSPALTYTPREYLRLASGAASVTHLSALTTGLERHWYAGRSATADDFRESLKNLEALGCKSASGPESE